MVRVWGRERNLPRIFFAAFLLCLFALHLPSSYAVGPGPRVVLSLFLYVLAPGFIPALLLRTRLGLRALDTLPLGVSFGLGQAALLLAIMSGLSVSVLDVTWVLVAVTVCWYVWAELGPLPTRRVTFGGSAIASGNSWFGLPDLFLLIMLVGLFVLLLSAGAPSAWQADSAAHLAAIRGVIEEGRLFPAEQPYGLNGVRGPDPRFGIFHGLAAALVVSSCVEIHRLWDVLPAFFGPMLILGLFFAARCIAGSTKVAFAAAFLFVLCFGGTGEGFRIVGYPSRVSMLVYLVSLGVAFKYLRDRARWSLVLVGILMASATAVHVYHVVEFVFVITCFSLLLLLVKGQDKGRVLRGWGYTLGAALCASLPILLHKFSTSYSVQNVYNVEAQGVLFLDGVLYMLNPFRAFAWLGFAGAVSIFLLPYFLARAGRSDSYTFVGAATAGPLLVVFNPVLMPFATKVLSFLASRLIWAVPYSLSIAMFLVEFLGNVRSASLRKKILYVVTGAVILVALVGTLNQRISFFRSATARDGTAFPENLSAIAGTVGRLDVLVNGRKVFLSDPVTAYAIPAFSRHYVTAIPVAHASPADPRPVSRIRDAIDVLNWRVGMTRTASILSEYNVDFVVVNTSFKDRVIAFEYEVDPEFQQRALEKLSAAENLFEKVLSENGFNVFRVINADSARRQEDSSPAGLMPGDHGPVRSDIADFGGLFSLQKVDLSQKTVGLGEFVEVRFVWRCLAPIPRENVYKLFIRAETPFPEGRLFRKFYEKPYRKLLEKRVGKRYRFKVDADPEMIGYPLHLWREGQVFTQTVAFQVPQDVSPGVYTVKVNLRRASFIPNYRLSDYFRDEDYYSGVKVGSFLVRADGNDLSASVTRARPKAARR
jgi:hypothetical protein